MKNIGFMVKKIVLCSSMKNRDIIKDTMIKLEELGFEALFPNIDNNRENKDTCLTIEEKHKLAKDHYEAIDEADMAYFILPKGYIGTSCKIELGYALAKKKLIYFSDKTQDISVDSYMLKVISLDNLEDFNKL